MLCCVLKRVCGAVWGSEVRAKIEALKEKGAEAKRMTYEADESTMDADDQLKVLGRPAALHDPEPAAGVGWSRLKVACCCLQILEAKLAEAESAASKWQQRIGQVRVVMPYGGCSMRGSMRHA